MQTVRRGTCAPCACACACARVCCLRACTVCVCAALRCAALRLQGPAGQSGRQRGAARRTFFRVPSGGQSEGQNARLSAQVDSARMPSTGRNSGRSELGPIRRLGRERARTRLLDGGLRMRASKRRIQTHMHILGHEN
jgi:hypothetical protein